MHTTLMIQLCKQGATLLLDFFVALVNISTPRKGWPSMQRATNYTAVDEDIARSMMFNGQGSTVSGASTQQNGTW